MYRYRAKLLKVIDGDTVDLEVDLGFYTISRQRFRLTGINTMEMTDSDPVKKALAVQAKLRLAVLLTGKALTVESIKTEKYGRWLGTIFVEADPKSVNQLLVEEGLAVVTTY